VRDGFRNPVGLVEFDIRKERAKVGEIAEDSEGETVLCVELEILQEGEGLKSWNGE